MDSKTYTQLALNTDSTNGYQDVRSRLSVDSGKVRMLNAALGISGESGEVVDLIKKHIMYDSSLDLFKLQEEIGDLLWYVSLLLYQIDSSFEEVMEQNIEKLKKRYPTGFSEEMALIRNDKGYTK